MSGDAHWLATAFGIGIVSRAAGGASAADDGLRHRLALAVRHPPCRHRIENHPDPLQSAAVDQTKRTRPHTAPALLARLWVVLTMLEYLKHNDLKDLKQLVRDVSLPFLIFKCGSLCRYQ